MQVACVTSALGGSRCERWPRLAGSLGLAIGTLQYGSNHLLHTSREPDVPQCFVRACASHINLTAALKLTLENIVANPRAPCDNEMHCDAIISNK